MTELRIVHGEAWLIASARRMLRGPPPVQRSSNTLTLCGEPCQPLNSQPCFVRH